MPQHRTRAQKIQAAERRISLTPAETAPTVSAVTTAGPLPLSTEQVAYAYVRDDLRRIALITLGCLVILAVATLFLSDFAAVQSLRHTLRLG